MLLGKRLVAIPLQELERGEARGTATDWKMTGRDPQFALGPLSPRQLMAGHYRLTISVPRGRENLRSPMIYVDHGAGPAEGESQRLSFGSSRSARASASFSLNTDSTALRFDPSSAPGEVTLGPVRLRRMSRWEHYLRLAVELARLRVRSRRDLGPYAKRAIRILGDGGPSGLAAALRRRSERSSDRYADWIGKFDFDESRDRGLLEEAIEALPEKPLISVVMPVYNTPAALLDEAIRSVVEQVYPNWELCIADDGSTKPAIRQTLEQWRSRDSRVKVVYRQENGHISTGPEFCRRTGDRGMDGPALTMTTSCRHMPSPKWQLPIENPDAQMIYSDEDKIDDNGRRKEPYFKTDWELSPVSVPEHVLAPGGIQDIAVSAGRRLPCRF